MTPTIGGRYQTRTFLVVVIGGLWTLLVTPFALADVPDAVPSADTLASVVVLGLFCSALAFLFFFRLIAEIGPGRATIITYVNPVVALALGVAILDESITTGVVVGLLLILAGSWLSTDGRLPPGLAGLADRVRGRPRARGSEAPS